jgi:glycosyltransferase involved in cell wall biosynthesis
VDASMRALRSMQQQQSFDHLEFPLNRRVVEASRAVIVHNGWAKAMLRDKFPAASVYHVPMGTEVLDPIDRRQVRSELGLPPDAFTIGTFGHLNVTRRLDMLMSAFARLVGEYPQSMLLLVGSYSEEYGREVRSLITSHGLESRVVLMGYLPNDVYTRYMQACDAVVNLRYPTAGASSSTILRAFGAGVPVIASDVPEFAGHASEFCVLIPVGDGEGNSLHAALERWAANRPACERAGAKAREWAAHHAAWPVMAERYAEIIAAEFGEGR